MVVWKGMRIVDIIAKKRDGGELSLEEIKSLVDGYVDGSVPEYQVSAWLMAVFFRGMTGAEAGALTRAMIDSGKTMDLSGLSGPLVDKHSTGGVGDKVSLILAPIVAACGVQIPMMSGRALGHTGGTLDKLESITGFSTAMDNKRFAEIIDSCGFAMTGQSKDIVPADRLLYALRDVTATVESIPLITASIMSKKFAEGAESLIFDVKTGAGAFMKSEDDARQLAESLLETGKSLGRGVVTVLTNMDEPLGSMVGNFLEVEESAYCLMGPRAPEEFVYPEDLMEVTLRLSAWMLVAATKARDVEEGEAKCREVIENGDAYKVFLENVKLQGGDVEKLERDLGTRRAKHSHDIETPRAGTVAAINAYEVGMAGVALGVGRNKTEDDVLPDVGVEIFKKIGSEVGIGEALCRIYGESEEAVQTAAKRVREAFEIADSATRPETLIVDERTAL